MKYYVMSPPFEFSSFSEMSKQQAKEHFEWYIKEIPKRIEQLQEVILLDTGINLDYTSQSLEDIWTWYIERIKIYNKTTEELEYELENSQILSKSHVRQNEVSMEWLAIAIDISIYFAECMLKNNDNLKWDVIYSPKSFMWVNRPVIVGFKHDLQMNPENLIYVQTRKILRGKRNNKVLVELFNNWQIQ